VRYVADGEPMLKAQCHSGGAPNMFLLMPPKGFSYDKQAFHQIPEGMPAFEELPPR
jgi:hypothetical protein